MIRGNECIEMVSVPGLQTYFTNLTMSGREYAYYQITYLDFPVNDSLTKHFRGDSLSLNLVVITTFQVLENPSQAFDSQFDINFEMPINRIASQKDIAETLW